MRLHSQVPLSRSFCHTADLTMPTAPKNLEEFVASLPPPGGVGPPELAQLSAVGDDSAPSPDSATQQGPSTGHPPPPVQMPDNIGAVHGMNGTDPDTGCPTHRPAPTLQLNIGTAPHTGASDWDITHFRLSQLQQVEYREFLNGMEGLYVSPSGMMSLDTASATEIYGVLFFCQYAHDCELLQALVIGRGETARFSEWNINRLGGVWGGIRHQFYDDYSPSHNYTVFLPTKDVFAWDMHQRRHVMDLYRALFGPNERDNAAGAVQRSAPKPTQMKRLQSSDELPSLVIQHWEDLEPQGKSIRANPSFMETGIS